MTAEIQILGTECLTHLRQEELVLRSLHALVVEFRKSIEERDSERLHELIDQHAKVNVEAQHVAARRDSLRHRIAVAVQVPVEQATVGCLAEQCEDPLKTSLRQLQQQLRVDGEKLSASLISSHNLAFQLYQLLENVFRSLSGDPSSSPTYERSGRQAVS